MLFALVPPVLVSVAACPVNESKRSIPPPPATLPLRLWRLEAQAVKHTLCKVVLSCDYCKAQKALTTAQSTIYCGSMDDKTSPSR